MPRSIQVRCTSCTPYIFLPGGKVLLYTMDTDKRCRSYRNGLNTIALTWVEQRQARHRFLQRQTFTYTNTMQNFAASRPLVKTPQELIQNYLDSEIDPLAIERLLTDMTMHYIRPTNDWNLSPDNIYKVLEYTGFIMDLLRGIFPNEE